ncbi:putative ribonuclease H-like domain-containing protein [Tanacetum coccineum]|uniref:Ribonuclease H-like domain-containing protein n=1 Tax=Tanacetum coccineum TaxID=301880 RepID=A0ABQ5GPS4_9ASTR
MRQVLRVSDIEIESCLQFLWNSGVTKLEVLGPSEATSKALYQSTSNVEKTVGKSKCKKGKRTDGKLLVVDKDKKKVNKGWQKGYGLNDFVLLSLVMMCYASENGTTTSMPEIETSISKTSKDIVEKPKTIRPSAPIIEEWDTNSDNDSVFRPKSDQTKPKFTKINFVKSGENVKSVNKENTHRQVEYPRKSQSPRAVAQSQDSAVNATRQSSPGSSQLQFIWRPKGNVIDHISKDSGSYMLKRFDYVDLQAGLRLSRNNGGFVAYGGSPKGVTITGKTECLVLSPDFKLLDKSQVLLKVPRHDNMYSFDLKNVIPSVGETLFKRFALKLFEKWTIILLLVKMGNNIKALVKVHVVRLYQQPLQMLHLDSIWPTSAEAVNTACYVHNRVLVTKPHNKTHYKLLHGRPPSKRFMRLFGFPVTILNTLDLLGKFDGKADEGFLVGYCINSKAFRVFNTRTRKVEENLHITFLENLTYVSGSGPDWLFDIDLLTNSMNYKPVTAGNQTNRNAFAGDAGKKITNRTCNEGEINGQRGGETSNKEGDQHVQDLRSELDKLLVQQKEDYANNTNRVSTVSPSISAAGQSFVNDLLTDPLMPDLEDTTDLLNTSIFSSAYDDEDVGAEADLDNMETTMNVWRLVDLPKGKHAIGTKWVYRNKKDKRRIEAIRLFLAYASFMGFIVYQMDVKSAFLYGTIEEEVAWYETLSTYLLENGFRRGTIDKTLFIKKDKDDAQEIPDEFYGELYILLGLHDEFRVKTGSCKVNVARQDLVLMGETCLERTDRNAAFHEIFWNTAHSQTVNDVKQIHATVDGKTVVISKSSVRSDLHFNDEDGITCLTNENIFKNLALMGQMTDGKGLPLCLLALEAAQASGDRPRCQRKPLGVIALIGDHTPESDEGRLKQDKLMDIVTTLLQKVEGLESGLKKTKKIYATAFKKLINRVKSLEDELKFWKSKSKKRRLTLVTSDDEEELERYGQNLETQEGFGDSQEVSTHARVSTASTFVSTASPQRNAYTTVDDLTIAETLMEIKKSAAKDKGKAKMDETESPRKMKQRERAQISRDEEVAQKLQE